MDYEIFKTFIHPDLLKAFLEPDDGNNYEVTLQNSFNLAVNDFNQLNQKLDDEGIVPKFDKSTYVLKKSLALVYNWILQNKAFLMNINLSGLGLSESDVYNHFRDLKESEELDIQQMRQEALTEYFSITGKGAGGAFLKFAPNKDIYRRNRRR